MFRIDWVAASLTVAGSWSLALAAGVGKVPVIGGTSWDSTGVATSTSRTLVEEIGAGAYAVACVPLVATILVGVLATLRSRRWPVVAAVAVVGIVGGLNLLAMLTIGIYFVPATAALVVAVGGMAVRASGG